MNIILSEVQLNNLITFLDRVPVTGFNEIVAFNEILNILTKSSSLTSKQSKGGGNPPIKELKEAEFKVK